MMNAELWPRGFLLFLKMIGKQQDKSGFVERVKGENTNGIQNNTVR